MPAWARPVRILDKLTLSVSIDLPMRVSADVLTSERLMIIPLSNVYQRAFIFARNRALQRTGLVDGKHLDRQLLITTQGERRGVHDFEAPDNGFIETDARIAGRAGILVGIGTVYAIDLRGLEDDFSADF